MPGCVTCHMWKGTHDVSQGITIGGSSQGKFIGSSPSGDGYHRDPNGIAMNEISPEEFKRERDKMVTICKTCHAKRFVRHKLAAADGIKIASDGVTGEAVKIIEGLRADGLKTPCRRTGSKIPLQIQKARRSGSRAISCTNRFPALRQSFFICISFTTSMPGKAVII